MFNGDDRYWVFDVLVYLCKAKFLTRDPTEFGLNPNRGWFLGILFGIIIQAINLRDNMDKESKTSEGSDARAAVIKEVRIHSCNFHPDFDFRTAKQHLLKAHCRFRRSSGRRERVQSNANCAR